MVYTLKQALYLALVVQRKIRAHIKRDLTRNSVTMKRGRAHTEKQNVRDKQSCAIISPLRS